MTQERIKLKKPEKTTASSSKFVNCEDIKDNRASLKCYENKKQTLNKVIIGLIIACVVVGFLACYCYFADKNKRQNNTPGKTVDYE